MPLGSTNQRRVLQAELAIRHSTTTTETLTHHCKRLATTQSKMNEALPIMMYSHTRKVVLSGFQGGIKMFPETDALTI